MMVYGGVYVYIHIFSTLALVGRSLVSFTPRTLYSPGERALCTHWIGAWVDPKAGLYDAEKRKFLTLPGLELRPLSCPAHGKSLYCLRYPGSLFIYIWSINWSLLFFKLAFWGVAWYSVVDTYQCFIGTCYLNLTLLSWRWKQQVLPRHGYLFAW
jgi:hypothetical protein